MGYKLALMMFIVASMGVGLWIIAGNQESDPSESIRETLRQQWMMAVATSNTVPSAPHS
ncbi:Protein CBG01929 [Caenorhabditis briggsae]|uniref:Protein CBG01929 n=1 Tax=Caenorhabditis briggsae TaxID=6238 RepID=A8WRL7_CAEBR|nr:Protein CBG01929 [Caenorhabditis briggsae]CAP23125.1 Protein CBG01929 [Caenorhabditis briggsae]